MIRGLEAPEESPLRVCLAHAGANVEGRHTGRGTGLRDNGPNSGAKQFILD